jgi:hypothetical protein
MSPRNRKPAATARDPADIKVNPIASVADAPVKSLAAPVSVVYVFYMDEQEEALRASMIRVTATTDGIKSRLFKHRGKSRALRSGSYEMQDYRDVGVLFAPGESPVEEVRSCLFLGPP